MYNFLGFINNKNMISPLFSLLLVIILLFVLQLTLKSKLFFNVNKNSGKIQIKFLNFTIIDYTLSFHMDYIKLTNKKGKNTYLPLEFNQQTIEEYNNFQEILFKKTYFKNVSFYLNFGKKDNAFLTSITCGIFDVITKIFYSILKTGKNEVEFNSKIYPNFKSNVIKIGVKAKLSLSIYDLIWSYFESKLTSKIIKKRSKQNARQQNRKLNGAGNTQN